MGTIICACDGHAPDVPLPVQRAASTVPDSTSPLEVTSGVTENLLPALRVATSDLVDPSDALAFSEAGTPMSPGDAAANPHIRVVLPPA